MGLRSACVAASGLLVAWWAQVHTCGCVLYPWPCLPPAPRPSSLPVVPCRCPWLTRAVSPAIPVYNGVLFLFVLANFSMATFMDPGVFPRGRALYRAAPLLLCTRV